MSVSKTQTNAGEAKLGAFISIFCFYIVFKHVIFEVGEYCEHIQRTLRFVSQTLTQGWK